jgi:hypothetical protein
MPKNKKSFYFSGYGYTPKDFKKWGKLGGRPPKHVNQAERQKAYRRRKALAKLNNGERVGILNMTTGRINQLKSRKQI